MALTGRSLASRLLRRGLKDDVRWRHNELTIPKSHGQPDLRHVARGAGPAARSPGLLCDFWQLEAKTLGCAEQGRGGYLSLNLMARE
jgi:hypothetical protein